MMTFFYNVSTIQNTNILFLSVCFCENLIDDIITQIGFCVAKHRVTRYKKMSCYFEISYCLTIIIFNNFLSDILCNCCLMVCLAT